MYKALSDIKQIPQDIKQATTIKHSRNLSFQYDRKALLDFKETNLADDPSQEETPERSVSGRGVV